MSLPPSTIRIKRKRDDSEAPVTFLQLDETVKRARNGSGYIYQRKQPTLPASVDAPATPRQDAKPTIHVSPSPIPLRKTISPKPSLSRLRSETQRRFHLSKSHLSAQGSGVLKKRPSGPAVFVERNRKRVAQRLEEQRGESGLVDEKKEDASVNETAPSRKLKRPGTKAVAAQKPTASAAPLPASAARPHEENMDHITADMNSWVMAEIGATLQEMDREKQRTAARARPKAPALRYADRHPESRTHAPGNKEDDDAMAIDSSDEDDGDWVIEEYVRIPLQSMAVDVNPGDVGVLVLEGEEEDVFFFGPAHDEDDDCLEDDEDENAENHYTADYPEDEVDSDDEYNRHAYFYRTQNASDDEEYDNDLFEYRSDDGEDGFVMEGDDHEEVTMARIKRFMERSREAGYR